MPDSITDKALARGVAQQAREECAALVEACTDVLDPMTARKVASRIRALNSSARPFALSLIDTTPGGVDPEMHEAMVRQEEIS